MMNSSSATNCLYLFTWLAARPAPGLGNALAAFLLITAVGRSANAAEVTPDQVRRAWAERETESKTMLIKWTETRSQPKARPRGAEGAGRTDSAADLTTLTIPPF